MEYLMRRTGRHPEQQQTGAVGGVATGAQPTPDPWQLHDPLGQSVLAEDVQRELYEPLWHRRSQSRTNRAFARARLLE